VSIPSNIAPKDMGER